MPYNDNKLFILTESPKVKLHINRVSRTIALLVSFFLISSCANQTKHCSDNWKITGFYTPIEQDFSGQNKQRISLEGKQSYSFPSSFLNAVKMEGWGKTRFDWYLGRYGGQWHKASHPLNAKGTPLKLGAIAVDSQKIAKNTKVHIPALAHILHIERFIAVDVGSSIKNQHIDVYTGEGRLAKTQTHQVTGIHRVCIFPNENRQNIGAEVIDLTP